VGWVLTGTWRLISPAGSEERDMTDISWVELLIIIVVIAFLILVPKRLPGAARRLRRAIRGRKKGSGEGDTDTGDAEPGDTKPDDTKPGDTDPEAAARDTDE
jgi:Sec-independent protein translocase protein TatA